MRRFISTSLCSCLVAVGLIAGTAGPSAALVSRVVLGDGFEYGLGDWQATHTGAAGFPDWRRTGDSPDGGSFAAHVVGAPHASDQLLTTGPLPLGSSPSLSFQQHYDFEQSQNTNWDGGVVEFSTDDGQTWQDLSTIASVPYTGTVNGSSGNPLDGRSAFVGLQAGYAPVTVPLTALADQTVRLRFRLGADDGTASNGWWVDDVSVTDQGAAPFPPAAPPTGVAVSTTSSSGVAVTFTPAAVTAVHPIVAYVASCTSTDGGTPATAVTRQSEVLVQGLTVGKHYGCRVRGWTTAGLGQQSSSVAVALAAPRPATGSRSAGNAAVAGSHRGGIATYDALVDSAVSRTPSAAQQAAIRRFSRPGTTQQMQVQLGVPTTLWAARPGPVAPAARGERPAVAAARGHLTRLAGVYRLSPADVAEARSVGVQRLREGGVLVQLAPEVHGVPVWHERATVVMNKDLGLVGVTGYLLPPTVRNGTFSLSAGAAVGAAYRDLTGAAPTGLRPAGQRGGYSMFRGVSDFSAPARAQKVMYRLPSGLVAAYYVELSVTSGTSSHLVGYVVTAADGGVLSRSDLGADDNADFKYRGWADPSVDNLPYDSPQGTVGSPDPSGTPDSYVPPYLPSTLIQGPLTAVDPWLQAGAVDSQGNNVDAYADVAAPDGFSAGDFRSDVNAPGAFDHNYDFSLAPSASTEQGKAGITQLFYDVNYLHDWFYASGFTEAAGNAQVDNYGRGGLGGDPVLAEDQDYSGIDNANMATPADGASPRMQMYVWDGPDLRSLDVTGVGSLATTAATFGPTSYDVTASVVAAQDGVATTTDGCESITNNVSGAIALIDRGTCTFITKAHNAEAAGAVGVLIANNSSGPLTSVGGTCPGTTGCPVTVPVMGISGTDGSAVRGALPTTAHMTRAVAPARDGALDTTVVSHEWGHYLSHRLVPGLSSQQAAAMGEGWSDFVSLLTMVRSEDVAHLDGAYATGAYAAAGFSQAPYYFGIRRAPYSTNFAINDLTFKDISDSQALPTDIPLNLNGGPNAEVHNAGEIWAGMLWECYAALLADTTGPSPRGDFAWAKRRMSDYLVASLKATPSDPTYLEARDAVLMTAAAGDPADYSDFAAAFARRGAGIGAVGPARDSTTFDGVVESYTDVHGAPTASVQLSGGVKGNNGWYRSAPVATVTTVDGAGLPRSRCVLDDPTHDSFASLPADAREPCDYAPDGARMPEGVHTLSAASTDLTGTEGPVASTTVKVDSQAPRRPTLKALPAFTATGSATLSFRSTDVGSGIGSYDVQVAKASYRAAGLPTTWSALSGAQGLAKTSFTVTGLAAGTTYCFRVVAHDRAGNVGEASTATCTARLVDDPALTRSSGWKTVKGSVYLGGSAAATASAGRSLSLTGFHGTRLAIRATTCPTCGSVDLYVGSKRVARWSLVASKTHPAVLLQVVLPSATSGAVKVVTRSTRQVVVDALGVSQH